MINGQLVEKLNDKLVIDANGVGYGVFTSLEDYSKTELNKPYKLYIYEHIREQSHDLFGFLDKDALELFERLINVNGVGPKMALSLLSIGTVTDLKTAITSGEVRYLTGASGVGKRVAERIIVDLREKLGVNLGSSGSIDVLGSVNIKNKDEAVEALIALGYTLSDAIKALDGVEVDLPTEERIRLALRTKV